MTGMETMLPGGELLYRSACTYDRAGNSTGREEQYRDAFSGSLHTAVTTYTYDGMGRLTGEELDGKLTGYSYDMTGNRLSRTTEGRTERYHYNSRNQLTELDSAAETVQQEYDHAGNLTAESHIPQGGSITKRIEYTYDAYDRNTSVCSAGCVQQNHYDAEGLRNAVTENGSTTNFVYRNGMLSSELDADRNPVRGYVYGNEYISQNNGSSSGYYLNDEQGSIRYLTGSDGSIRNHYRYSAFGESITAEETVPNRLKYNAQMADELTGLYYLRARYYNASLGRFTQEDVIYNDGLNLYAYCNSNPVMYSDPSGFAKETCKSKVGGECDSESGTATINPNDIRFSQSSVNGASEIIDSMKAKGWDGDPIDVVRMPDGNLTTIDNTRVLAARYAEIDVQANVHAFDEVLPQDLDLIERLTTPKGVPQTWGDAVLLRIGKQNSGYRNTYPLGSNIIGWSGN